MDAPLLGLVYFFRRLSGSGSGFYGGVSLSRRALGNQANETNVAMANPLRPR
jgi:hypothetical protein